MNKDPKIAWAINPRSDEGHGLLGVYFMNHYREEIPPWQQGNTVALFKTREQARKWRRIYMNGCSLNNYCPFPKMKVVKVKIAIEEW